MPDRTEQSHLPRLDRRAYRGTAIVHWSMTMGDRRTGWLDSNYHAVFRELLLHALARYGAACPAYCLMPDHAHLLMMGLDARCDQVVALRFLRQHLNRELESRGYRWQKQSFDHVLRNNRRERSVFPTVAGYIIENPVRAGLVESHCEWPYSGALFPGYPDLGWGSDDYWERFWKIYNLKLDENAK